MTHHVRYLLSLPPAAVRDFPTLAESLSRPWWAASDPQGQALGSAGGSVHLLREAWRAENQPISLGDWAAQHPIVMVHGSGLSRRLPAYAPLGKPLIPMPIVGQARGQRLDQTLLDLQIDTLDNLLERSPHPAPLLIASGDVLVLMARDRQALPDADVVVMGMRTSPAVARHFGVFICRKRDGELEFMLQKPAEESLRALGPDQRFLLDVGLWVLGPEAVRALLSTCLPATDDHEAPVKPLDLYTDVGLSLGRSPSRPHNVFSRLSVRVVEIGEGAFYHFGTSRQLVETTSALQHDVLSGARVRGPRSRPEQIILNSVVDIPVFGSNCHTLWIENAWVPAAWSLEHSHVITGIPENQIDLRVRAGVCLDVVPLEDGRQCLRPYGIDDSFTGVVGHAETMWMGVPLKRWLAQRGLTLDDIGCEDVSDIHEARLFPVIDAWGQDPAFVEWMVAEEPRLDPTLARRYASMERLSAAQLLSLSSPRRLMDQRKRFMQRTLNNLWVKRQHSVFYSLDFARMAPLAEAEPTAGETTGHPLNDMFDQAWLGAVRRARGLDGSDAERQAFQRLRDAILEPVLASPVAPHCTVLPDQIVWARSPVRLDLAGGWTDTPPYCVLYGGHVTNVAVDLNGQPPVQCFIRPIQRPEIRLHSIDRGEDESVTTFEDLNTFHGPGTSFAIAKAGLALSGFLPSFSAEPRCQTLADALRRFGAGLEISLLSAVPQGSGLGTSSILAATLLAGLNEVCGLGWTLDTILERTLALEQLMTTGGGWQDQAGGAWPAAKLIESEPGIPQHLHVRWAPHDALTRGCGLLYYTGLTRVAKGILQEIVRGLFLNESRRLRIIHAIGEHALETFAALQQRSEKALGEAIARSWELNQALDAGTNPPSVQVILNQVSQYLTGAKLLGAGGGGYLLMMAKDPEAARRVRLELTTNPPNERARFVEFRVSTTGLEVSRS